jgi:NAD(P)-dependent dehydrogenase (short-subunit alcohol dehydrogenase family)
VYILRLSGLDIEVSQLVDLEAVYPEQLQVFRVDVCNEEQIKSAVAAVMNEFQTLDIAIHNACLCTFEREADTDLSVYRKVFDVNYYGALRFVKCVIPYLQAQKKGKVMFTSSGVGVTGFIGISPYASTKGALEALAKCLNIEYAADGVSFHILHPPLTRTKSSEPLPVPKEFMADPQKVGYGLAKHINGKHFIICHSFGQKVQTLLCYLCPIKMGKLMSKMTMRFVAMKK